MSLFVRIIFLLTLATTDVNGEPSIEGGVAYEKLEEIQFYKSKMRLFQTIEYPDFENEFNSIQRYITILSDSICQDSSQTDKVLERCRSVTSALSRRVRNTKRQLAQVIAPVRGKIIKRRRKRSFRRRKRALGFLFGAIGAGFKVYRDYALRKRVKANERDISALQFTTVNITENLKSVQRDVVALSQTVRSRNDEQRFLNRITVLEIGCTNTLRDIATQISEVRDVFAAVIEKRTTAYVLDPEFLDKIDQELVNQGEHAQAVRDYSQIISEFELINSTHCVISTTIPTLDRDYYYVFEFYPIPDLQAKKIPVITNEFAVLTNDKSKYFPISPLQLEICRNQGCPKPVMARPIESSKCGVAQIDARPSSECQWVDYLKEIYIVRTLHGFIFATKKSTRYEIKCGREEFESKLRGTGIITIIPLNCKVTIYARPTLRFDGPVGVINVDATMLDKWTKTSQILGANGNQTLVKDTKIQNQVKSNKRLLKIITATLGGTLVIIVILVIIAWYWYHVQIRNKYK